MKTLKYFVFALFTLLIVSPAFALQCKDGQSLNSDECWTEVRIAAGYTTLVSRGHVLVASYQAAALTDVDGWTATHPIASNNIVLGVAQSNIATGDTALILARGRGVIKTRSGVTNNAPVITSGDPLGVSGFVSHAGAAVLTTSTLNIDKVANSFETQTANDDTTEAYIDVV